MGVVNVTPDSFSDGGRFFDPASAVEHALHLASEGADILDIGGESSRPGSTPVSEAEEMRRVIPVIKALRGATDLPISVDTTKAAVAKAALDEGAAMINDITALRADERMAGIVSEAGCAICLMHMKGEPRTMQKAPVYADAPAEIRSFLKERIDFAVKSGIARELIFVDPGIGFGKRLEDNLAILKHIGLFKDLGCPVLIGASRKAFIGMLLDQAQPDQRLFGTLGAIAAAVAGGADAVRVHDVKPARELIQVMNAILRSGA